MKFHELASHEPRRCWNGKAANTGEHVSLSRTVLARAGIRPTSVMLVSRPYSQRQAYATCR